MKTIEIYKELLATCPDAGAAGHVFEWHTGITKLSSANWASGNEHVHLGRKRSPHTCYNTSLDQFFFSVFSNCFSWYHRAENHDIVLDFENKVISAVRDGHAEEDWVDCANGNRTDPIQR